MQAWSLCCPFCDFAWHAHGPHPPAGMPTPTHAPTGRPGDGDAPCPGSRRPGLVRLDLRATSAPSTSPRPPHATRRVVVVDDEEDVQRMVARCLGRTPAFEVVGRGGTGVEALELARSHHPDVLLLDLGLADIAEDQLISRVVVAAPRTMVAILTGRAAQEREAAAREAGAFAYYEKDMIGPDLVAVLDADCRLFERALDGEDVVAPSVVPHHAVSA